MSLFPRSSRSRSTFLRAGPLFTLGLLSVTWSGCSAAPPESVPPSNQLDTSGWLSFSSSEGAFSARFPLVPSEISSSIVVSSETFPTTEMKASTPDWSVSVGYAVMGTDWPAPDVIMSSIRTRIESMAQGRPIESASTVRSGCNAWEISGSIMHFEQEVLLLSRLYFCGGRRFYYLSGVAPLNQRDLVTTFVESFVPNP